MRKLVDQEFLDKQYIKKYNTWRHSLYSQAGKLIGCEHVQYLLVRFPGTVKAIQ